MRPPHLMRYFAAVAETRSIRKAAESLNVAGSAISRHIRETEQALNLTLLYRSSKGIRLTDAGEIYAKYCKDSLVRYGQMKGELSLLNSLKIGQIKLYAVEGTIHNLLIPAIAEFSGLHPDIEVVQHVGGTIEVLDALRDGRADVGMALMPQPNENIESVIRFRDLLCFAVSSKHRYAKLQSISLDQLRALPVALLDRSFRIRSIVDLAVARADLRLRPVLETNSVTALRYFALSGAGAVFINRLSVLDELQSGKLVTLAMPKIFNCAVTTDVCVVPGRHLSPAVEKFIRFMGSFGRQNGFSMVRQRTRFARSLVEVAK